MSSWSSETATMPLPVTVVVAAFVWSFAAPVQSGRYAVVTHNVNLRADPSTENAPIRLLHVGDSAQLVSAKSRNGFYHAVVGADTGWVWTRNVKVGQAQTFAIAPSTAHAMAPNAAHPCGDPHYRWVEKTAMKNGQAEAVTIHEVLTSWEPPEIANTAADWCAVRDAAEERKISVVGWVRRVKNESDGDWHIELTAQSTGPVADHCIVVEIPPADIKPAFATARHDLARILGVQAMPSTLDLAPAVKVRVTGTAFFDGEHRGAATHPMTAHAHGRCNSSARALWEIHPVTKVEGM